MRAAMISAFEGPRAVTVDDVSTPKPAAGAVTIDVRYAGVTFPDVLQTWGRYQLRPDPPFTPGWEIAGVVRDDAGAFRRGDRVAAMPIVGGFAETVNVEPNMIFPVPDDVSLDVAAALPLNYLTADFALRRRGGLRAGECVLVQGAGGGVGTASCQLAAALGARVIAVVSSAEKAERAERAGAHDVVMADDFLARVRELTDGRGVDLVVDPVGGDRFLDSLRSMRPEGRLLVVGFAGGGIPTVKTNRLLLTNTSVMGVAVAEFWRAEPAYARSQWDAIMPRVRAGELAPVVGNRYPLSDISQALQDVDERRSAGKALIEVRQQP
jgi:NADPH2:quinone reductase